MYGDGMGTLSLDAYNSETETWTTYWSASNDHGTSWFQATVQVRSPSEYAHYVVGH